MTTLRSHMNDSLRRSLSVLETVKVPKELKDNIFIESYANGREHGFAVSVWSQGVSRKLVFSENRNSDDMVLYAGDQREFTMNNVPDQKSYAAKRLLNGEEELVEAIEKELAELVKAMVVQGDWAEALILDKEFEMHHCPPNCGYTYWEMKNDISHS